MDTIIVGHIFIRSYNDFNNSYSLRAKKLLPQRLIFAAIIMTAFCYTDY